MKQRLEATHFIEVWQTLDKLSIINSELQPILMLDDYLEDTAECGLKTIAVWKIKYK